MIIAGHVMAETIHGFVCRDCGRKFCDISGVLESDIGKGGFAHQGMLNRAEFDQIKTEVERQWACVTGVASGRGIGGSLPGSETMEDLFG